MKNTVNKVQISENQELFRTNNSKSKAIVIDFIEAGELQIITSPKAFNALAKQFHLLKVESLDFLEESSCANIHYPLCCFNIYNPLWEYETKEILFKAPLTASSSRLNNRFFSRMDEWDPDVHPTNDLNNCNEKATQVLIRHRDFQGDTPKYTLTLDEDAVLTTIISTASEIKTHEVYRKKNVDTRYWARSIRALLRKWLADRYTETQWAHLSAEHRAKPNIEPSAPHPYLSVFYKDCFFPRFTQYGIIPPPRVAEDISVIKTDLAWIGPHECEMKSQQLRFNIPVNVDNQGIQRALKNRLARSGDYILCQGCCDIVPVGHQYDNDVCYGCASNLYGVMY